MYMTFVFVPPAGAPPELVYSMEENVIRLTKK